MFRFDNSREESVRTGEVGLKGKFETGAVAHDAVLNVNLYHADRNGSFAGDFGNTFATNLYSPRYYAQPGFSGTAFVGNVNDRRKTNKTILRSIALGDTLSMLNNRFLLTLGARHQQINTTDYAFNTQTATGYDKSKLSPVLAAVIKPWEGVSLYANYVEGLTVGETAPTIVGTTPVINSGQQLSPYVSKQKEVGAKFDFGKLRLTTAYFTTEKPRGTVDTAGFFSARGSEDHQGVEIMTLGELMPGVRVLGGVTFFDTKQKNTGDPATENKQTIGIPDRQANLGMEWDVPGIYGFTLDARVIATGNVYADAANTLRVPGWTRLDIGARYATDIKGHLVTVRGRIDNVADRDYWASSGGFPGSGYLVLGAPRTITVSAQLDF